MLDNLHLEASRLPPREKDLFMPALAFLSVAAVVALTLLGILFMVLTGGELQ